MTPRSVPQRLAAWLMVALLALIVGEPLRAHVCPMHDGSVMVLLAGGATHGSAHGSTHDTASHGSHGAGHDLADDAGGEGGAPADQVPVSGPHSCQCLGACCVTAPVATPTPVMATSVAEALVATVVAAPAVPAAVPGTGDVVLPFAIGPPSAV